ncbi:MAG: hypothetical protein H7330_07335 [Hymenobacteraceae bacterium]|nr:hypothetical protein [Hymenobacteraceae bacterium]
MATTYLPNPEQERSVWLTNFSQKLPTYVSILGLPTTTTASIQADAAYYAWVMKSLSAYRDYAQAWTAYKNALATGDKLGDAPIVPTVSAAPSLVAPDVIGRLTKLVTTIKNAPAYTAAIGEDLNIIGPESVAPKPETLKPLLKVSRIALGELIKWSKQGNRRLVLHLEVDRDGTGWQFLALDTEPDYIDTLTPATPATWKYRAQYRLGDVPTGEWSDVVSVVVG